MSRQSKAKGRAGRTDAMGEARDLVALLGALSDEGAVINAQTIADRMGVNVAYARKLLLLVVGSGAPTQEYLPLTAADSDGVSDDEVVLMTQRGVRGRPLRFTHDEAVALTSALNAIGVPEDDPLRRKIRTGYGADDISGELIDRTLGPLDADVTARISPCAQAIVSSQDLAFSYQGISDTEYRTRNVHPIRLRRDDNRWYLDALDLDIEQQRTFRIDRMRDVCTVEGGTSDHGSSVLDTNDTEDRSTARFITLVFTDEHYLTLFDWPGIEIIGHDDRRITARIPYYGRDTDWLVRRIASCAGTVTTDDTEIASKVRKYVSHLLFTA